MHYRTVVFLLALVLAFFSSSFAVAEEQKEPIQIGSILYLTGEGSAWGNASKNGIEMAISDINKKGGVLGRKLVASHQDDQGEPNHAISAFRHLTDIENVKFIVGTTWSNSGFAVGPLADRKKVIMISPSLGRAEFNESSKFLFNVWPHDSALASKLADLVYQRGYRNIALVGAEEVWVKVQTPVFKARFEELGGNVAFLTEPLPAGVDARNLAIKIKNTKGIDAFVSTTNGVIVGSLVAKALKEIQVDLPKFSITLDQSAIDAAQGGFEGLEFLTSLTPTPEFQSRYELEFGTPIDIGADSAYDAVMLIAKAIEETKSTDTEVIAGYLAKVKTYEGVSGTLISDGKRGFNKESRLLKVENGKPRPQ